MKNRCGLHNIIIAMLTFSLLTGCGAQESNTASSENIELKDPVGVTEAYEIVTDRDLYDVAIYSTEVVPYVEEYSFAKDQTFKNYVFSPGQTVKSGDVLVSAKEESVDDEITDLSEQIADLEQDFNDDVDALNKDISDAKKSEYEAYEPIAKMYENAPPEDNEKAMEGFNKMLMRPDSVYKRVKMGREQLEEQLKERQELFNLEHQYYVDKLGRLQAKKGHSDIASTMAGDVVSIGYYYDGDNVPKDKAIVAVGDMNQKLLKTDYISSGAYNKAEEVYAIVNGERYELNYQALSQDKVNQMNRAGETIYSTFDLIDPENKVQIGDFVTIVMVKSSRKGVPTVPIASLTKEEDGYYTYLFDGEESKYVPVQIGMKDGLYAEVLTGLNLGDKVLSDKAVKKGSNVKKIEYGECSTAFNTSGFLFYPTSEWLTNPAKTGTCYVKEILVENNQQVTKGETIATIEVTPDQIEIERLSRQVLRAQERLVTLNKKKADNDAAKKIDRSVERSIVEKNKTINKLMRQINKLKQYSGIVEIKAPYDGIITDKGNLKEGDLIYAGSQLVQISDTSLSYIIVEDTNNQLTYGNKALISSRNTGAASTAIEGTVCTVLNTSLSEDLRLEWSLISIPKEQAAGFTGSAVGAEGRWDRNMYKVNVTTRSMKNVLVVPKSAVTLSGGCTYVNVVNDDGSVTTRAFIAGGSDGSNYWVADGLEEGMTICWG